MSEFRHSKSMKDKTPFYKFWKSESGTFGCVIFGLLISGVLFLIAALLDIL